MAAAACSTLAGLRSPRVRRWAQVMRVTRGLAREGMTVVATIHCPPPHTFALFDRLLVLQRGRAAYFGANGPSAAAYFLGLPAKAWPPAHPGRSSPPPLRAADNVQAHPRVCAQSHAMGVLRCLLQSSDESQPQPTSRSGALAPPLYCMPAKKSRPPWGSKQAPLGNVQVRAKGADENLADWIVHITTDADRQGDDGFVQAYARCASRAQPTRTASEWLLPSSSGSGAGRARLPFAWRSACQAAALKDAQAARERQTGRTGGAQDAARAGSRERAFAGRSRSRRPTRSCGRC